MSLLNGGGSLRALGLKALAVVFVLLMTELAPSSHAQLSELDTSAAEAAREIGALKKRHHKGQVKLVVANFWDLSGSDPRLGPELTDRFRTALERNAEGFTVLDRGNRSGEAYDVNDPKACQVNPFGANEVIDGYVESVRENIATVWVEAHGEPARNFMEKVTFTLPPELASLGPGSDSTSDRIPGESPLGEGRSCARRYSESGPLVGNQGRIQATYLRLLPVRAYFTSCDQCKNARGGSF